MGVYPGPLAYRGLGCELEQAALWALGKVFEQSHRLGWAPGGNGALGSVAGNGMSAQLVLLLNQGAAMPVEGSELPGSAPTPAWPPLQGKRHPVLSSPFLMPLTGQPRGPSSAHQPYLLPCRLLCRGDGTGASVHNIAGSQ